MQEKRLDILLVAPYIFYPLDEGGKISQFAMIDYLRRFNNITLVFAAQTQNCLQRISKLRELLEGVNIEIITLPGEDEIGFLPKVTRKLDWVVNKKQRDKKAREYVSEFDNDYFINIGAVKKRSFIEQLAAIAGKKHYDIAQVDMHSSIDLVYCLPANAKKIFVQHEIRFVRLESFLQSQGLKAGPYEKYILSYIENTEVDMLNKYDAVFTFSETDTSKLSPGLKSCKVYTSPFPVLDNYFVPVKNEPLLIKKIVFIGGSIHSPNVDAVRWFVSNVLPAVSKIFNLKLHIAGNWDEASKEFFNGNNNVIFSGFVEDIVAYCKESIMVVPVRAGSGIRTKILYAMAQGVPVISTTLGCEGIEGADKKSILIADDAPAFINSIEQIVQYPDASKERVTRAQEIIKNVYSQAAAGKKRQACYLSVLDEK
jgi:glycosyltransferase involved in cell wall biosynthesis